MYAARHTGFPNAFTFVFFTGILVGTTFAAWHYGEDGSDTDWSGLCKTGKYQSPVDLAPSKSAVGKLGGITFSGYDGDYNATIRNSGHSLEIRLKNSDIFMKGAGLPGTYTLDHLHFHWNSEHTITGRRFALECHFVHKDVKFETVQDAIQNKDGIAVVAALFHVAPEDNPQLKQLLEQAEKVYKWPLTVHNADQLSPQSFLPDDTTGFYRYHGSLTTPNCDESVVWTVFTDSLPISENQIERFKSLRSEDGKLLLANNRPVKPLTGRLVTYQESQLYSFTQPSLGSTVTVNSVLILMPILRVMKGIFQL